MGRTRRWVICSSLFLFSSLVVGTVGAGPALAAGPTNAKRVKFAIAYLRTQQAPNGSVAGFSPEGSTADALLAVAAVRRGKEIRKDGLTFLLNRVGSGHVTTPGLMAKVVLALVASGKNPRAANGHDLVAELQGHVAPDGSIDGAVFDQALVLLALKAAKANPPAAMSDWLLAAQCPDGGWSYDAPYDPEIDDADCFNGDWDTDWFTADTNTTSYAVQALTAVKRTTWAKRNPIAYFKLARDPGKGGWAYSPAWVATDTNSTALVLQAYAALGTKPPKGAVDGLRKLQYTPCGAWSYSWNGNAKTGPNSGATIGAIPGLLGKAFPLKPFTGKVRPSGPPRNCPAPRVGSATG